MTSNYKISSSLLSALVLLALAPQVFACQDTADESSINQTVLEKVSSDSGEYDSMQSDRDIPAICAAYRSELSNEESSTELGILNGTVAEVAATPGGDPALLSEVNQTLSSFCSNYENRQEVHLSQLYERINQILAEKSIEIDSVDRLSLGK